MIIQCNSCKKSFTVPNGAITQQGRLVQCSSCGNKWTQYPTKKEEPQIRPKVITEERKIENLEKNSEHPKKNKAKKKKKLVNTYSEEYLQKKHGIRIINPSNSKINEKEKKNKRLKNNIFGFYNYLITFTVLIITIFGFLHLTQEIIIQKYPFTETYINYLFETFSNFKLIIQDIISNY